MRQTGRTANDRFHCTLKLLGSLFTFLLLVGCGGSNSTENKSPSPKNASANKRISFLKNDDGEVFKAIYSGPGVTDADLEVLKDYPKLENVEISECPSISDDAMKYLESANLKKLNLIRVPVTDKGMLSISQISTIEELGLFHVLVTDEGLKLVQELQGVKNLFLQDCENITGMGLVYLKEMPNLKELSLTGTSLAMDGLRVLGGLVHLEKLAIDSSNSTDEGLKLLTGMSGLKTFHFSDLDFTNVALESITAMSGIESLNFRGCKNISDDGLVHFKKMKSLQSLLLNNCQGLTGKGLTHFEEMTWLKELSVADSPIQKPAAVKLKAAIPQCKITYGQGLGAVTL